MAKSGKRTGQTKQTGKTKQDKTINGTPINGQPLAPPVPPPPPPPPVYGGPVIACAACKKLFPLGQYIAIRHKLYVFPPNGIGIFEKQPYCSLECWEDHPTPLKREVRALWDRCHHGAKSGDQCTEPGTHTCGFNCCRCRACATHAAPGMVLVGSRTHIVQVRRNDPLADLANIMTKLNEAGKK